MVRTVFGKIEASNLKELWGVPSLIYPQGTD